MGLCSCLSPAAQAQRKQLLSRAETYPNEPGIKTFGSKCNLWSCLVNIGSVYYRDPDVPKPANKQEGGKTANVKAKRYMNMCHMYIAYVCGGGYIHGDSQRLRNVPVGSDIVSGLSQVVYLQDLLP